MDKKFVMGIAAMAALTLVSCSSDDLDSFSDNSSKNEAISFDGYLGRSAVAVNGTRGSVETKETLKTNGFAVFGKYTPTEGQSSDFFDNQKVTYSTTTSKWTYTPLRYWPTNGKIDFFAYAPHKEGQKLKSNTTTFDFTVDKDIAKQKDLLWANATGQITGKFEGTTKEKVTFLFKHALSRLGYSVKLSGDYTSNNVNFKLNSIKLAGSADGTSKNAFYKTGTIDLSKENNARDLWDTSSSSANEGKQNFDWVSSDMQVDNTGIKNAETDYLFVIPQDFSQTKSEGNDVDELYVIVEYDVDYKSGTPSTTITNTVYKKLPIKFEQGKAYMLNLTIGLPIEFDVDVEATGGVGVEDWGTDENINIGSNDENPWDRK